MIVRRTLPWLLIVAALQIAPATAHAGGIPPWLPRYDLKLRIDPAERLITVRERVTWTNRHKRPAHELIFNAHSHYAIPDKDVGLLAKMVELLRMAPREAMNFDGPPLDVKTVALDPGPGPNIARAGHRAGDQQPAIAPFDFHKNNHTALVIPLAQPVGPGESVTVELNFTVRVPPTMGRWGQWHGVTTLAQWLPVLAFYD